MRSTLPHTNGAHHESDVANGDVNEVPAYTNTAPSPFVNGMQGSQRPPKWYNRRSVPFFDGSIPSFEPQTKPEMNGTNGAHNADEDFPDTHIPTLMLAVKRLKNKQQLNGSQLPGSMRSVSNGSMEDGITAAEKEERSRARAPAPHSDQ